VHSGGRSSTGELLTYFYYIFTIIDVVTFTIYFSLQKKCIRNKWSKNMAKALTTRKSPLMAGPSMTVEAEKHIDDEIDTLFCLTL
jgi:hypothetical protein